MPRGIFILAVPLRVSRSAATVLALGVAVLQGCAETSAPEPAPLEQHSCSAGKCVTCYIYQNEVECIKDE